MESKELMIGDWIKDTNGDIHRVNYISECRDCIESDDSFGIFSYDLLPIPLTAKILKKNGFVNDSSYDECVADGHFITIQIWSYNTENVLIQWDGITCEVINDFGNPCEKITLHGENYEHDIYVHELQHALRLCGLTELADNFRV